MMTKCLLLWVALLPGGERERGLALYADGKFAAAAAAFRAAIERDGDAPDLQWNLALASWRAGDLAAAEAAVEKYAAMARNARPDLHAGLLGAVRHDEAKALEGKADGLLAGGAGPAPPAAAPGAAPAAPEDPLPLLEQALQKATQARDHFVRGATAQPSPELLRNTERSLRTIDELQKKIDELKKQREQQQDDEKQEPKGDDKKDDDKKDDDKKDDEKDQSKQDSKEGEQKPDQKPEEPGEKSEPKPDQKPAEQQDPQGGGEEKPEPKPDAKDTSQGEDKPQPAPGEQTPPPQQPPRSDAPGEAREGKALSPEQAQRLQKQLEELDQKLKSIRARAKSSRPPVERDW